jgi:hypothetical protein
LEVAHQYLRSLEGTLTLHAQVLQQLFVEFGDLYTLLDVYNIFEKLELVHAHFHHVQGLSLHQLRQLDHHIFFQRLKRCI